MNLKVKIGYHVHYLPTPRCRTYRYEEKEELVDLELPEAPESELTHIFDVFENIKGLRSNREEHPWDIAKTRIYQRAVDGKDIYYREAIGSDVANSHLSDAWLNPLGELVFRLEHMDQFVLHNKSNCRDFLINKATTYLNSFLLSGSVLYKKIEEPVWRVHSHKAFTPEGNGTVRIHVTLTPHTFPSYSESVNKDFSWNAREEALAYAEQEAQRVNAKEIEYSKLERIVPITSDQMTILVTVNGGQVQEVSLISDSQPKGTVEVELIDFDTEDEEELDELDRRYHELKKMPVYVPCF